MNETFLPTKVTTLLQKFNNSPPNWKVVSEITRQIKSLQKLRYVVSKKTV